MVPKPLYSEGFVFLKNVTQWDADIGKDYVPKNADDFKRVMQALTKPQRGSLRHRRGRRLGERRRLRHQVVLAAVRRAERVAPGLGWQAHAQLRDARVQRGRRLRARPVRGRRVSPEHAAVHAAVRTPAPTSPAAAGRSGWTASPRPGAIPGGARARPAIRSRCTHPALPRARRRQAGALPERGAPGRDGHQEEHARADEGAAAGPELPGGAVRQPGGHAAVVRRRGPRLHARRQGQSGADRARQSGRELPAVQVRRAAPVGAVPARHPRLHQGARRGREAAAADRHRAIRRSASSRRRRSATARWSPRRFRTASATSSPAAVRSATTTSSSPTGAAPAGDQIRKEYQDAICRGSTRVDEPRRGCSRAPPVGSQRASSSLPSGSRNITFTAGRCSP